MVVLSVVSAFLGGLVEWQLDDDEDGRPDDPV
jgi:hypothetical protein